MIIRILHEGQYDVDDATVDGLNELDGDLQAAVEAQDEEQYRKLLGQMLIKVRTGTPCPDDFLGASESVLPAPETALGEIRSMLASDGLVPG